MILIGSLDVKDMTSQVRLIFFVFVAFHKTSIAILMKNSGKLKEILLLQLY